MSDTSNTPENVSTKPSSLTEAIAQFVTTVSAFAALHTELRANEIEQDRNAIAELITAWNQIINDFMLINGFFDFVLSENGMQTSGIVDLETVISQIVGEAITDIPDGGGTQADVQHLNSEIERGYAAADASDDRDSLDIDNNPNFEADNA